MRFTGYKILNFNFRLNDNFPKDSKAALNVNFSNEIIQHDEENFSVILNCAINNKDFLVEGDEIPFDLEISVEGVYQSETFDEELIPNAIAIIFPYLRSFISTLTAQAGISPFILPTININRLLEEGK